MSVHFICGKPGGGKSLYGVKMVLEEIIHGGRDIVTNLALKLDMLNSYLQSEYPLAYQRYIVDTGLTISDRITLIEEEELKEFYRNRGRGQILPLVKVVGEERAVPDYSSARDRAVFYVLDEVHIAFNAREWARTGKSVLYYLSQHRKLGDDVICITQAVGNVDKQFRSVAQDYTYIRNLSKVRLSLFRLPGVFWRSTYLSVPNDTTKPNVEGTFTLDVNGIASLYDTAKGVGIHGRSGADTKERKKGLPFWLLLILIGVGLVFVFAVLPKILLWYLSPNRQSHGKPALVPSLLSVPTNSAGPVSSFIHSLEPQTSRAFDLSDGRMAGPIGVPAAPAYLGSSPLETNNVFCTGYCLLPGAEEAYFSDGTTAYGASSEIQAVTANWVFAWGRRFRVVVRSGSTSGGAVEPVLSGPVGGIVSVPEDASKSFVGQSGDVYSGVSGSESSFGSVQVLPSIHGNFYNLTPPGRLNGIASLSGTRSDSPPAQSPNL